jgi:uncharacterized protein
MSYAADNLSAQYSIAERQVVRGIRDALRAGDRAILLIGRDSGSVHIPDAALVGCTSADRLLRIGPPLPELVELKKMIAAAAGIVAATGISPQAMARLLLIGAPKQPVVLAIDDADRLPRQSLFFLAQLSDSVASLSASMAKEAPALQIVLAATAALLGILSQPDFKTFQSRITIVGELPETLPARLGTRAIAPQPVPLVPAAPAPHRLGHLVGGVMHTAPGAYRARAYRAKAAFAVGGLVLAFLAFIYGPTLLLPGRSVNSGAPRKLPAAAAGGSPSAAPLDVQETDRAIATLIDNIEALVASGPSGSDPESDAVLINKMLELISRLLPSASSDGRKSVTGIPKRLAAKARAAEAAGRVEEARRLEQFSTRVSVAASADFAAPATDATPPQQTAPAPTAMPHADSGTAMPDHLITPDQTGRSSSSRRVPSHNEENAVEPALPPNRSATSAGQHDAADRSTLSSNVAALPAPDAAADQPTDGTRPVRVAKVAPSGLKVVANPSNETNSHKKAKPARDSNTLGIVTGNDTEFAAAEDVVTLISTGQETGPHGEVVLGVVPILGGGGVQNIRDVLTLADADMSIVPVPLLDRATATLGLEALRRHIVYITPLFEEEFHLLASRSILNISDLAGKTVNLGMKNGAADVLGREIFVRLGIDVNVVNLNQNDAINAMSNGRIEADLVLSGKPVRSLASYTWAEGFHFIAIPHSPALEKEFLPATLTHGDYPNLISSGLSATESVDTIGVDSVLIAYNWPKSDDRYRLLDLFVRTLFSRFSELQSGPHHPKWREVSLAASLAGWAQFPPAQRWVDRKEFESFLSKRGIDAAADRGRLRQDFLHLR